MKSHYQLIIIGAGPAGLAAAVTAANHGIDCALFDEQPAPGGQIYRAIESIPRQRAKGLGTDYMRGRELAEAFRVCNAEYFPETRVWSISPNREVGVLYENNSKIIQAEQILLATGAMERPVPFPGWTLPGVMQAGAGQVLLKTAGVVPSEGVVLAGSGPLLLLLAWQYMQLGVGVKAMLDTTPLSNFPGAIPWFPRALLAHHYLTKGLVYQRDLKRAGVPNKIAVSQLRAQGNGRLQSVHYHHLGREHALETEVLMTHFGVIPHIWLSQAAGCKHQWDKRQQCWRPQHDKWGNTRIPGIMVAGDGAGINGARSAEYAGRVSAYQALFALGVLSQTERDQQAVVELKSMRKEKHIRPFLEAYFAIPQALLATTTADTIVCRCEEVTAGQIRAAVAHGHTDSNQVKYLTRCGMGACQGRQCANAVAHIIADAGGQEISADSLYRVRPPVAPLTLQQLASLAEESAR